MRIFLTGGTGFIGGEVARRLRERGDEVVALVRSPVKATALTALGCALVQGDLDDQVALATGMTDTDAVIHGAAIYKVGIPKKDRLAMFETNVDGTRHVLRAALEAKVPKAVYVSTVAVFGNTKGQVVDEGYQQQGPHTNYYEETKVKAHAIAESLIAEGLPLVIVQPGAVYGPGDHSELGTTMRKMVKGKLPAVAFPKAGFNLVHRDDVADGILLALDKGKAGESYVLGGEIATMADLVRVTAEAAGRKPPRMSLPTGLIKAVAPFGRVVGPLMGYPPNMRELVTTSDGVTYWAKDDKARAELGYSPRDLATGIRDTLAVGL